MILKQKNILRYSAEFLVILCGVSASFWVEEYRESLQNKEEMYKVLDNLKIELDEIDNYCQERKQTYKNDHDIILNLLKDQNYTFDSIDDIVDYTFEIENAIKQARVFQPPMNTFNSIINEGTLKFVKSDTIKKLLGQLNNTNLNFIQAVVEDDIAIKEKIESYLIINYPEIIIAINDNVSPEKFHKILKRKIKNDSVLKAYTIVKSRNMFLKSYYLQAYIDNLLILRDKIQTVL